MIQRKGKLTSKTERKCQIKPKPKVVKKRQNIKYKRYNNEDKLIQSPHELKSSDNLEDIGYDIFNRFWPKKKKYDYMPLAISFYIQVGRLLTSHK